MKHGNTTVSPSADDLKPEVPFFSFYNRSGGAVEGVLFTALNPDDK